ncbi:hypothetical protein [Xenorhabdus ehlersii]|uniref:hypothetical protein n=1 Tax=Xenorhabdus ehlersii TaxID=290111 RepID=UPI0030DB35CC
MRYKEASIWLEIKLSSVTSDLLEQGVSWIDYVVQVTRDNYVYVGESQIVN